MAGQLDQFLDDFGARLKPTGIGRALDDRRLLAQATFITLAVGIVNWALLVAVQLAFGETITALIDLSLLALNTVGVAFFIRNGNIAFYANLAIWSSAVTVVAIHVVLGGYAWSGSYLLWGISNVVLAALWLSIRTTTVMASLYLAVAIVFVFLEPTFQQWRGDRPDPNLALVNTVQVFVTTVLVIAPVAILLRERIFEERSRSRALMLNILPASIADRLQANPGIIADDHKECTVLFADLVGFTAHSREISAQRLVEELNQIFVAFDRIVLDAGGEKIKTMGDGYMAAFGIPESLDDHVGRGCQVAIDIVSEMDVLNQLLETAYEVRVGVATGSAVAGVIGDTKFSYDVWSDTVTLASRLERSAKPNTILVSAEVAAALNGRYDTVPLGELDLKGRGSTSAFMLSRPGSSESH